MLMSGFRIPLLILVGVAAGAVALATALGPAASVGDDDRARPSWWKPPADVRAMLRDVDDDSLERYDLGLVGFGTRHTLSSQDDPNRGIGAARDWIKAEFDKIAATSGGRMTVELDSYIQEPTPRVPTPTRITNVVATLRGTDPTAADRVYVVGAHYDSRVSDVLNGTSDAPGANDDASGTAAVLELARVFAPRPTEATIQFVAFAGEEQGLLGSDHFAQLAQDQGRNIQGVLNMDIIGSPNGGNGFREPRAIRVLNEGVPTAETPQQTSRRQSLGGENDGVSRQLARYVEETGENSATGMNVKLVYRRDRFGRGGDQISFLERGWSAVRFSEPNENFDHQHQDVRIEDGRQIGDLPQFVDFDYLTRVTRVVGSSLAALARSPRAPGNVRIPTALSYDAEVSWNASPEADVVGYEVVWRDSVDQEWTRSRQVGNVTTATIENLNKDNFQIGVRAIDRNGNRSPVATP
jgi:Zn-dependent M28 family amino/carboxypeptidase